MNVYKGGAWRFKPFHDCPAFYTNCPPNWFHRLMLRLLLGWRWTKE